MRKFTAAARPSFNLGARWLIVLLFSANALGFLLQPIGDPDFFWHLRHGEWIREHRALPQELISAIAPRQTPPAFERFTMTSYWLAQLLLAVLHDTGGLGAIVTLRWVLFFLLLLLIAQRARGDGLVCAGLLSLGVILLGQYPAERPQYYSFVFAAVLLLLLAGLRAPQPIAAARWRAAAVIPLMALWANCHGGFVVGLGFLGVHTLAESLKLLDRRLEPLSPERFRILLAAAAGGFLASLLNPNDWMVFRLLRLPAGLAETNNEYRSTIEIFRYSSDPWVIVYWLLLAVAITALALSWRKPDLSSLGLVLLTGYFSFTQVRYVAFFVVAAIPATTAVLSDPRVVGRARMIVAALGLCAGGYFLPDAVRMIAHGRHCAELNGYQFPVGAAGFVEATGLQGSMFNQYEWGGYLLWRLTPRKVFIDGRNADPELLEAYQRVLAGDRRLVHGAAFWKSYLERYEVRYTVTSFFDPLSGELLGLIDALLADPAWVPVYSSTTAVVFAEDVPENREVIRRNALPKEGCYPTLLQYTSELIAAMPAFVPPHVARGDLFLRLGDRASALGAFEAALRLAPEHPVARARVAALQ